VEQQEDGETEVGDDEDGLLPEEDEETAMP